MLVLGYSVVVLTVLSISAIATSANVETGGVYCILTDKLYIHMYLRMYIFIVMYACVYVLMHACRDDNKFSETIGQKPLIVMLSLNLIGHPMHCIY